MKKISTSNQLSCEIQLSTSYFYSFILLENNLCYVWGANTYGQLGLGHTTKILIPTLFKLPNNERIISFASGEIHSICLTEKNSLYVYGSNTHRQLGLREKSMSYIPTLLSFPNNEKVSFITCGAYHTVCLTENNSCCVWGSNEYGQLGLGDTNNRSIPTLLTLPNNEKISFIACGNYHTTCLTENNLCYVWGLNNYGQLGLGLEYYLSNRFSPTLLSFPNNERISFITCGAKYTICLTENNSCYVWGSNYNFQLGLGHRSDCAAPTLLTLPNNERIFFINSGYCHTVCLTENNSCYVWGWNEYGQLGLGDTNNHSTPTSFSLPNNELISFIAGGFYHTICLTENNLCYIWGSNEYDELGLGHTGGIYTPTLLQLQDSSKFILE